MEHKPAFSCQRCGYPAQFNWSGLDVCGLGCYELLTLKEHNDNLDSLEIQLRKLIGFSEQAKEDLIGNLLKQEESVDIPCATYSKYYPKTQTWVIELNKYHRDNLLWLFNAIGYPYGQKVEPFNCANSGDWVGEIPQMLCKPNQGPELDDNDIPNYTLKNLESFVDSWLISKKFIETKK